CAPVQAQHPGGEPGRVGVLRHEYPVLEPAGVAEAPLNPPRRVPGDLEASLALELADLPRGTIPVRLDREVRRDAEVALPARREADVRLHPGHPERAQVLAIEILADHVPGAV